MRLWEYWILVYSLASRYPSVYCHSLISSISPSSAYHTRSNRAYSSKASSSRNLQKRSQSSNWTVAELRLRNIPEPHSPILEKFDSAWVLDSTLHNLTFGFKLDGYLYDFKDACSASFLHRSSNDKWLGMVDISKPSLVKCSLQKKLSILTPFQHHIEAYILYDQDDRWEPETAMQDLEYEWNASMLRHRFVLTTHDMIKELLYNVSDIHTMEAWTRKKPFVSVVSLSSGVLSTLQGPSTLPKEDKGIFIIIIIISSISALSVFVVVYYMCVRHTENVRKRALGPKHNPVETIGWKPDSPSHIGGGARRSNMFSSVEAELERVYAWRHYHEFAAGNEPIDYVGDTQSSHMLPHAVSTFPRPVRASVMATQEEPTADPSHNEMTRNVPLKQHSTPSTSSSDTKLSQNTSTMATTDKPKHDQNAQRKGTNTSSVGTAVNAQSAQKPQTNLVHCPMQALPQIREQEPAQPNHPRIIPAPSPAYYNADMVFADIPCEEGGGVPADGGWTLRDEVWIQRSELKEPIPAKTSPPQASNQVDLPSIHVTQAPSVVSSNNISSTQQVGLTIPDPPHTKEDQHVSKPKGGSSRLTWTIPAPVW